MNPEIWRRTLRAFRDSTDDELDCRHAASQLLLDIWLYIAGCIDSQQESPFAELAGMTRSTIRPASGSPTAFGTLAYGDRSREGDLTAMVKSQDPGFQELFRKAFWTD